MGVSPGLAGGVTRRRPFAGVELMFGHPDRPSRRPRDSAKSRRPRALSRRPRPTSGQRPGLTSGHGTGVATVAPLAVGRRRFLPRVVGDLSWRARYSDPGWERAWQGRSHHGRYGRWGIWERG